MRAAACGKTDKPVDFLGVVEVAIGSIVVRPYDSDPVI
jgi:hypothetical protein